MVLQHWATDNSLAKAGLLDPIPMPTTYLVPYVSWWCGAMTLWALCWSNGMNFTINMSRHANQACMNAILHAPVDRFFDRTPVGRIMNRVSTDLMNVDTSTFSKTTQLVSIFFTNFMPLLYLHILMPMYWTVAAIPYYYMIFLLIRSFWCTMVPCRYLTQVSKSKTDTTLTEVDSSNAFVRASRKG